jgi:hypothetical protein
MIRGNLLLALSLLCLFSWTLIIGVLADEESDKGDVGAMLLIGGVKEISAGGVGSSCLVTICTGSGDWQLLLPAGIDAPEIGRTILLFCHSSGSDIVIDSLQIL